MPDEVRCTTDSNNTFTCDVFIGPDPAPPSPPPAKAPEQPQTATPNPAVTALVQGYSQQLTLPTPDVPYVTGQALLDCAGNGLSLVVASAAKGPLAVVVGFKAGFDAGKCLATEHNNASAAAGRAEGAADCAARGGTVTSVIGEETMCEVPVASP